MEYKTEDDNRSSLMRYVKLAAQEIDKELQLKKKMRKKAIKKLAERV